MKYLLKMVQNLKNQTLFYFYLGILLMCIPKIFLCKYENQNKPNGASPPIPSLLIFYINYKKAPKWGFFWCFWVILATAKTVGVHFLIF